jgi:type IV pilus assembly protein PilW
MTRAADPMNLAAHRRPARQDGLTLVELMIALALSLVLLAGMVEIYLWSSRTYRAQEQLSRMHDNARLAVDALGRSLRKAGYLNNPTVDTQAFVFGGEADLAINAGTGAITVRYQGPISGTERNCLGNQVAASALVVETLSVDAANARLQCTVGVVTAPLVDGVESIVPTLNGDSVQIVINLRTDETRVSAATGGDGRIRRAYTSAIALRNRLP